MRIAYAAEKLFNYLRAILTQPEALVRLLPNFLAAKGYQDS